jgi:hypothetical protein
VTVLKEVACFIIEDCISKVGLDLEGILSQSRLSCGERGLVSWYFHALEHEFRREGSCLLLLSSVG